MLARSSDRFAFPVGAILNRVESADRADQLREDNGREATSTVARSEPG